MKKRICVLTAGHLATSPRMLKAADAFAEAGYNVRVVSTRHTAWADAGDADIVRRRNGAWSWAVVDYRKEAAATYFTSGVRFRGARWIARAFGTRNLNLFGAACARERVFPEVVAKALEEPADLIYGGGGGVATTAVAGRRMRVPFGIDLEDFHLDEHTDSPDARLTRDLTARIEGEVLRSATFLTAGSEAIADAYLEEYGVRPTAINNAFPLPPYSPSLGETTTTHYQTNPLGNDVSADVPEQNASRQKEPAPIRLYWFSQTIGPGRGLEDAVHAVGLAHFPCELHLRGAALTGYVAELSQLAGNVAPQLSVIEHAPGVPDEMVELCRGYDIGLGLEETVVPNRSLCLTNKALTYILAGLAVVLTDTVGQRPLAETLGEGAVVYRSGDIGTLARGLSGWARDRHLLGRAKAAAWRAAQTRWHWDHEEEKGKLVRIVQSVVK